MNKQLVSEAATGIGIVRALATFTQNENSVSFVHVIPNLLDFLSSAEYSRYFF